MKKLQEPITGEMIHAVATLTAAGLPVTAVMRRSGATFAAYNRIQARDEWAALLASKEEAFARLMRGDA